MSTLLAQDLVYRPGRGEPPPTSAGGKARGLAHITAAGLTTAPWFVISAEVMRSNSDEAISPEVAAAVETACRDLAARGATGFAVRSSALDEDGAERSFAGQHETVLNALDSAAVLAAITRCRASSSAASTLTYRRAHGLDAASPGLAVIVQAMVDAEVSGVAFSRAPDGANDDVVIVAARGLGRPLVDGELDGDEYRVSHHGSVTVQRIDAQPWRLDAGPDGGVVRRAIPLSAPRRCLDDRQAQAVAQAALRLEAVCGAPQDVEWAYTPDGALIVLQTRPVTTLPRPVAQETPRVWDNANIIESFPGVTTPLTFSLAREAYASVYRQACRALGVSERTIAEHDDVFEQMIGLLQGRVYYNLNSWHQVLALLPGFRFSQGFLERMMGAARPGAGTVAAPTGASGRRLAEMVAITVRLLWRLACFEADARRFERALAGLYDEYRSLDPEHEQPDSLLRLFDAARRRSLESWRTPILNDLYLMLFHGALRRAATAWLGPESDDLVNRLLRSGSLPSTAPAEALLAIVARVRTEPSWQTALIETPPAAFAGRLASDRALREFKAMVDAYLDRWGDRCPEELKLDRATYREEPTPLFHTLLALLSGPPPAVAGLDAVRRTEMEVDRRLRQDSFARGSLRRIAFLFLLRRTRYHLRWREQMRFARGQIFGIARRVFSAMGRTFARRGLVSEAGDIHYLHLDEVRGAIRGTAEVGRLGDVIRSRRAAFDAYRESVGPPHRFETVGPVALSPVAPAPQADCQISDNLVLRGTGASPGRVMAPCVVIGDPRSIDAIAGRIVVAHSTDPGWVPIMVAAAGLLVERGSLLSHSAIVARELGLPTVVGVAGLMAALRTGQVVEMDGSTGEVSVKPGEART